MRRLVEMHAVYVRRYVRVLVEMYIRDAHGLVEITCVYAGSLD
jgi:hypothetical protein